MFKKLFWLILAVIIFIAFDKGTDKRSEERRKEKKVQEFYSKYPKFKKIGIQYNINRQDVNALLFKHDNEYTSFIEFQSAKKSYSLNELLDELYDIIEK